MLAHYLVGMAQGAARGPQKEDPMSAWTVGQDHIDLMVTAAMRLAGWNEKYINVPKTADTLGQELWQENFDSVNFRYSEQEPVPEYHWTPVAEIQEGELTPAHLVQLISAADCYDYQSCEHPAWSDSKAYWVTQAIKAWAEARLVGLGWPKVRIHGGENWKGWAEAAWGWSREDGFKTGADA
jgi:hypothetical protein